MSVKHCRICYKEDNDDLISVQLVQQNVSIADMIRAIAGIVVASDRRLPQNICLRCLDRLKIAFELRQQCISTDARLLDELCPQLDLVIEKLDNDVADEQWTASAEDISVGPSLAIGKTSGSIVSNHEDEKHGRVSPIEQEQSHPVIKKEDRDLWHEDVHYVVTRNSSFFCCGCTKRFDTPAKLKMHAMRQHRKTKSRSKFGTFLCTVCYTTFPNQFTLESHAAETAAKCEASSSTYECLDCSYVTDDRKDLFDHLKKTSCKIELDDVVEAEEDVTASVQSEFGNAIEPKSVEQMRIEEEYLLSDLEGDESLVEMSFSDGSNVDEHENEGVNDDTDYDEEREQPSVSSGTASRSHDHGSRSRIHREMCRIPKKHLHVVSSEDGYEIVELLQQRCCCCARMFNTMEELNEHLQQRRATTVSTKQNPYAKYTCEHCTKQFEYPLVFACHKRLREQRQFYKCKLCNVLLDSGTRLISHMLLSEEHANFFKLSRESIANHYEAIALPGKRCCCCHKYFEADDKMMDHISAVHMLPKSRDLRSKVGKQPFSCSMCKQPFGKQAMLDCHLRHAMNVTQYYCKLCDFETRYPRRIELHLYSGIHRDVMPLTVRPKPLKNISPEIPRLLYCCVDKCKKPHSDQTELNRHVQDTHLEALKMNKLQSKNLQRMLPPNKYVECDICGMLFKNFTTLRYHQAALVGQQYVCSICGVKKRSRAILLVHERSHTGERPFRCEFCDKAFTSKTTLTSHLMCHNPGNHPCEICGERFNRGTNLKRHIILRHGEATLQCESCPKKFKTNSALKIHRRVHTGEKKFPCRIDTCNKRYINVADRRRHEMAVHTQERPHKCSYCTLAFVRKRQLVIHERRHTGEKPFVCSDCGKGFVDVNPLRIHQRTCCNTASVSTE